MALGRVTIFILLTPLASAMRLKSVADKAKFCSAFNSTKCVERNECVWHLGKCAGEQGNGRCNDGVGPTPCFDVAKCAEGAPGPTPEKKWAFIFTHSLERNFNGFKRETIVPVHDFAKRWGNTDIVLLVPKQGSSNRVHGSISEANRTKLWKDHGVTVVDVDWTLPPGMLWTKPNSWCGPKDLMRLQMFGMEQYSSVVYLDTDTQIQPGDGVATAFKCASKNYFLSATGPLSPLNVGVMAAKPNRKVMQATIEFGRLANFSKITGWGDAGFAPNQHKFIGAECGQGYQHTFFHKRDSPVVMEAVRRAGAEADMPIAKQMERCLWNWQHGTQDCANVDCKDVIVIHKDKEGDKCRRKVYPEM